MVVFSMSKYGVFSGPYFLVFWLNTEKYKPEKKYVFGQFSHSFGENIEMIRLKKTSYEILLPFENWNLCILLFPYVPVSSSKIWYIQKLIQKLMIRNKQRDNERRLMTKCRIFCGCCFTYVSSYKIFPKL